MEASWGVGTTATGANAFFIVLVYHEICIKIFGGLLKGSVTRNFPGGACSGGGGSTPQYIRTEAAASARKSSRVIHAPASNFVIKRYRRPFGQLLRLR